MIPVAWTELRDEAIVRDVNYIVQVDDCPYLFLNVDCVNEYNTFLNVFEGVSPDNDDVCRLDHLFGGDIKWDGCANFGASPYHFCGLNSGVRIMDAHEIAYTLARLLCPKFDPEYADCAPIPLNQDFRTYSFTSKLGTEIAIIRHDNVAYHRISGDDAYASCGDGWKELPQVVFCKEHGITLDDFHDAHWQALFQIACPEVLP